MIRISDVKKVGVVAKPKPKAAPKKVLGDVSDASPAAETLGALIKDAVRVGAAAIHIEPHGHDAVVRYRVDGLLRAGKAVAPAMLGLLAARAKSLANLDAAETRVPQDGKFELAVGDKKWAIRVTILPVADGEKIVLHIADQSVAPHSLEKLGYWGQALHTLADAAEQTGLVVVGGPAGSGKTATLYGLLQVAADPSRNSMTVEDPIEQRLTGINQTPVNTKAGMTFGTTVRAVLHQDPNVLMVGDVNEPETAHLILQAALGGRLVLAGMAAHDIAASILHLIAMHAEPYVVASSVRVVANQRLVRRLCQDCHEQYKPTAEAFTTACAALGLHPEGARGHIVSLKVTAAADLGVTSPETTSTTMHLWRAKEGGCANCGNTGYKGRIVMSEVVAISPALQKLIFSGAGGAAFYDQAMQEGMVPLPLDGLVKASLGLTSLEELMRVSGE